jgi:2-polyprenyl-3-methyl-5-hydroxy-6-metoxy-1,4-benzoquinol methylase|tara:strand:+ start:6296 stop:7159 length:864 start_codon:yes stop_codon:yes gene_type:complete
MKEKELHSGVAPFLNCKDHLVSGETYEIMINDKLEMLVTSPIPPSLDEYYDSKEYQSHNKATHTLLNTLYNGVKKSSFKRKESLFRKEKRTQTILDVGAGTGDFLLYCNSRGYAISGSEPNQNAREKAQEKGLKLSKNLNSFAGKKFDIITLWHVLEHVPNLYDCIDQLKSLLSENGQMFVAVPNFKSYDAAYYKEFWAAYDVPRHLWHFSQKTIHTLFDAVDLKVVKTYPMKYDSFYVSLLSEKNKKGTYNFMKAFLVGLRSNLKAIKTKEYSSLIYELKHTKKAL